MIITLCSDFGLQDYSPGIAKGILLTELPEATLVDLSHDIAPNHLLQYCYFLKSTCPFFPTKTIHLALFDLFVRPPYRILFTAVDEQYFICSDNGVLPMTFGEKLETVFQISASSDNFSDWMKKVAGFIGSLIGQGFSMEHLETAQAFEQPYPFEPYLSANRIDCQIIHIDRFGNVVLNLSQALFEAQKKDRKFRISFARYNEITKISNHYSDVPEGEKLCLFNLGGYMEIAVNKGSAAQLFGFSLMREHQLIYQKISIEFL